MKNPSDSGERRSAKALISPHDFLGLGVGSVAYVRPAQRDGLSGLGLFSADGKPLIFGQTHGEIADAAARNDLGLATVH